MNIYNIEQDLIAIFDEIEENGGEITPELEKELCIKQEEFKEKIENYTKVIKLLEQDINSIKEEKKRLTDLTISKQKIIDRLTTIIIGAINTFGETKKSGVKYLDYGTCSVSIRNSKSVDIDEDLLKDLQIQMVALFENMKTNNQLDVEDRLNSENLIHAISEEHHDADDHVITGFNVTEDDLNHTNIKLTLKLPTKALLNGESYPVIREMLKHCSDYNLEANVVKSDIKKELEENGACAPNLARLVNNQSIQIK